MNRMRMLLVALSALAALLLAAEGRSEPAVLLLAGVAAHGVLWLRMARPYRRERSGARAAVRPEVGA